MKNITASIKIMNQIEGFESSLALIKEEENVLTYKLSIKSDKPRIPEPITLKWKMPSINVKGVWKCGALHDKRLQYDWELIHLKSRISVDAPIVSVFGHNNANVVTFACSDAINLVQMNSLLREEDNCLYNHFTFFTEKHQAITSYETQIIIDTRTQNYCQSINDVSDWWTTFENLKPASVPDLARAPMYSTWYQFHQNLEENVIIEECEIAASIGYELIILDDGWQTMDTQRGYDFTGDWEPERFPNIKEIVDKIHTIGMKCGLWFSVPFCGKKSKAYQKFKGKFLTEDHRWAPVFDPRYPEVRKHLIDIYKNAMVNYGLDAFKLDFIDDFQVYPDTVLTKENGRDYANVNEAVDRLLTDVMNTLKAIKPDVAIEFRQRYIGPAMRKFGNMFRAFDAPNDAVSNRIRIADVKMMCGDSAVHSDPQTWNQEVPEPLELAALQILNGFFGVPQMSVHLRNLPEPYLECIRFYTKYWKENASVIMDGTFTANDPLGNYTLLESVKNGHRITGVYTDVVVDLTSDNTQDFLNAKPERDIVIRNNGIAFNASLKVWDCQGNVLQSEVIEVVKGVSIITIPPSGMMRLILLL